MPKHTVPRVIYRYVSGRPIDGVPRTDGGYLRRPRRAITPTGRTSRWSMLPGWGRQAVRLGVPAGWAGASYAAAVVPEHSAAAAAAALGAGAIAGVRRLRRRLALRRFHATYIRPTVATLEDVLGRPVRLHVDPQLGTLTPRLAKPLSPAEQAVRRWYGEHVEPVLRLAPEHAQRALWALQRAAKPVTGKLTAFRRPVEETGQRIALTVDTPYLTADDRKLVSSVIGAKIPVADLVERWDMVGDRVTARWTVRRRPPATAGLAELAAAFAKLAEWEFYLGQGPGGMPVTVSLRDDSPHIAVSAGTGAGKSVLAQLIAAQVLARGGRVVILDRKGSHRWALGLAGVDYCTKPAQMHKALIREAVEADERNTLALHEPEDWDPGARTLIICEELNATIGQLINPGPRQSPRWSCRIGCEHG